jgi:SAM-dependent methyltransferase
MTHAQRSVHDPWYKKTITHRAGRRTLAFRVSQALFSSHEIDAGTRLLLRTIAESPLAEAPTVLDVGCGYGAIGVTLAATHPRERVLMVDRDALAVAYACDNAALNGVGTMDPAIGRTDRYSDRSRSQDSPSVTARGSLGYDDVREQFDLIATNIPGKAGDAVIRHLLRGAQPFLAPGGAIAVVAVRPLAPLLAASLGDDPAIDVTFERTSAEYVVALYRFLAAPDPPEPLDAFAAGTYTRAHPRVEAAGQSFDLTTVHGLPEFNEPSFATRLLLDEVASLSVRGAASVAVLNPGQGHAAVLLHLTASPGSMLLVGRDLLALRATAANLAGTGRAAGATTLAHTIDFPGEDAQLDLIVATIDDADPIDASAAVLESAAAGLAASGVLLVATTSTTAVRLAKRLAAPGLRIEERARRRGAAILAVTRVS